MFNYRHLGYCAREGAPIGSLWTISVNTAGQIMGQWWSKDAKSDPKKAPKSAACAPNVVSKLAFKNSNKNVFKKAQLFDPSDLRK